MNGAAKATSTEAILLAKNQFGSLHKMEWGGLLHTTTRPHMASILDKISIS